jgi:hypothetical protein
LLDYLDSSAVYGVESPTPTSLVPASSDRTLVKEKIPAPPDSDSATQLTVQKMCEYIDAGAADDVCRWWALQAYQKFARGSQDPKQLCWGVWWLVKHSVRFAKDEPRLFQVGEPEALDLLIAPAVLVRDPQPKEDCDGFTMLVCCLLKILGIPSLIVTVAADPDNPERWSHVFPMAQFGGINLPLDASHGKFPGWMVPREHIYRWQAWDLKGNPVQAFPPQMNTLHGYMRTGRGMGARRGMGQDVLDPGDISGGSIPVDVPVAPFTLPLNPSSPFFTPGGAAGSSSDPTSTGSSTNWAQAISSLVSGGLKAAQLATLPPGYTINPANGQLVFTGQSSANAQLTSSFATILPWLGIGLVAVLILPALVGKK